MKLGRRLGGWLGLLVVVAGLAFAQTTETLTIATYNIENYVVANRMTGEGYRKEYPKPEAEKRALRAVIRALHADVLMLQEMGPRPYLDELQRDLRAEGLEYPFVALAEAADADRHIAVLSRRPLTGVKTHTDLEFKYFSTTETVKRGLLEATIATSGGDLTLFGVHLKSRLTDRDDDPLSAIRRTAEATAVRDRVLRRFPDPATARFVILGDCNDVKVSKPLDRLRARGKTAIAELLPAADSRGEVWTHLYRHDETYSRLDHILASPGLKAAVRGGAATIFDSEETRLASDHRPVMVTLVFGQKKGDGALDQPPKE